MGICKDKNCNFCKIVNGELASYKVFEDELCVAFLPLRAINPGHLILSPKDHAEDYYLLSNELTVHLAITAKFLSAKIKQKFSPVKVGYAVAGFEVTHAHMHIIPLHNMHEITSSAYTVIENGVIQFRPENLLNLSDQEKQQIIKKLKG